MGTLILVRHGQASFGAADYDELSELGHEQSRQLGRWWAERGFVPDQVYVGPCKRHRQTEACVAEIYKDTEHAWPQAVELTDLDEYDADQLLQKGLPELLQRRPDLQRELERFQERGQDANKGFQRVLEAAGRAWARGELMAPGLRTWMDFRLTVERGVRTMLKKAPKGATVVAFTSGGPLAAAAGMSLELGNEKTLELSWQPYNAALARFLFSSSGRFTLQTFNTTDHLRDLTHR